MHASSRTWEFMIGIEIVLPGDASGNAAMWFLICARFIPFEISAKASLPIPLVIVYRPKRLQENIHGNEELQPTKITALTSELQEAASQSKCRSHYLHHDGLHPKLSYALKTGSTFSSCRCLWPLMGVWTHEDTYT